MASSYPPVDEDWERTKYKVSRSVVRLTVRCNRAFDIDKAGVTCGTGFVVDKRRGIILTNRHVVTTGPVVIDAKFSNGELLPAVPLYIDPVHDFAFLWYYPDDLEFLDYEEIPLLPEAACFGMEICVVGYFTDAKVTTLSCLDRNAPNYTNDDYSDFDTFYIQAAARTERASSGCPVVDKQGRAIGLNTGNRTEADVAYFFPLERVVRALSFVKKGNNKDSSGNEWEVVTVPRGTLQANLIRELTQDGKIVATHTNNPNAI